MREKIEQRAGPRAGRAAAEVARVIFDAGAEAHFLHHFQVVFGAHLDALGFEQLAVLLEPGDALAQFLADGQNGAFHLVAGRDELFGRENGDGVERFDLVSRQRLEAGEALDFVAEKLDAQPVLAPGGTQFHRVAAHAELAAREFDVVAVVLQIHQPRAGTVRATMSMPARTGMTIAS